MLRGNEIVKEPIFQTALKNGLRPLKRKPRAYRTHLTSGLRVLYGATGLLRPTYDYQLVIGLCKFAQNFNNDCSKKRNSDRSLSTTRPNSLKRYLDFVLSITSY